MSQPTLQKAIYMWRVWDRRADRLLMANHGPRHAQPFRAADMQPEDQGLALTRCVVAVERALRISSYERGPFVFAHLNLSFFLNL